MDPMIIEGEVMRYFTQNEKGYYVCKCCNAMTWKPEDHRCDGIRKKQLMALVEAATDNIRSLSDNVPIQSKEYYCREAEEILRGAYMIIEEQWDNQKTREDDEHPLRNGFGD